MGMGNPCAVAGEGGLSRVFVYNRARILQVWVCARVSYASIGLYLGMGEEGLNARNFVKYPRVGTQSAVGC